MSAWLVSDESLTLTRNSIVAHLGITQEKATKMVRGWAKLNRYALRCRYGDKNRAFYFTHHEDIRSPVQTFKSLECLRYQCSEGTPEKDMPIEWFALRGVCEQMKSQHKIDERSREYESAEWD